MKQCRWKDDYYLMSYELAKTGLTNKKIASVIGCHPEAYTVWIRKKPALKKALIKARKVLDKNNSDVSFLDYINSQIPKELVKIWNRITNYEKEKNGICKIERLLEKNGENVRQGIFLHSLVKHNFQTNLALRKAHVSWKRFNMWMEEDPQFPELLNYIEFLRGNFFEDALMSLVAGGDIGAIKHVNETFNAKRGYAKQPTQIDMKVTANIQVNVMKMADLGLSLECRKEILKKLRTNKQLESGVKEINGMKVLEQAVV